MPKEKEPEFTLPPKRKKVRNTTELCQRFEIDLGNINEDRPREFSYLELVRNAHREPGSSIKDKSVDVDEDSDEGIEKVAMRYEQKYGPGSKQGIWNDDIDKGEGYDSDDSFIDNSENYEEVVPVGMTTEIGGYYINTGKLKFVSEEGSESLGLQEGLTDLDEKSFVQAMEASIERVIQQSAEYHRRTIEEQYSEGSLSNKSLNDDVKSDLDDDLEEIGESFEQKYCSGSAKSVWNDDIDKGGRYDSDDSIIHDSENYEEVVSDGMATEGPGYCMNTAMLNVACDQGPDLEQKDGRTELDEPIFVLAMEASIMSVVYRAVEYHRKTIEREKVLFRLFEEEKLRDSKRL